MKNFIIKNNPFTMNLKEWFLVFYSLGGILLVAWVLDKDILAGIILAIILIGIGKWI